MSDFPILLMTKEMLGREDLVFRTIEAIQTYLSFGDRTAYWYIADGGSSNDYKVRMGEMIVNNGGKLFIHSQAKQPAGVVWNTVLNKLFEDGHEYYFRLEDDFLLNAPMDVSKYIEILQNLSDVAMIRLGLMPINLTMSSVGYEGEIFFDIHHTQQYAYSGNPGLVHKRMHLACGMFHETHTPGDIELDFDEKFRNSALRILWPMLIASYGTYGPFSHIGDIQSY